jgi:hypothetical protein
MHGELKKHFMNQQHEHAMTAKVGKTDDEKAAEIEQRMIRAREAGL